MVDYDEIVDAQEELSRRGVTPERLEVSSEAMMRLVYDERFYRAEKRPEAITEMLGEVDGLQVEQVEELDDSEFNGQLVGPDGDTEAFWEDVPEEESDDVDEDAGDDEDTTLETGTESDE